MKILYKLLLISLCCISTITFANEVRIATSTNLDVYGYTNTYKEDNTYKSIIVNIDTHYKSGRLLAVINKQTCKNGYGILYYSNTTKANIEIIDSRYITLDTSRTMHDHIGQYLCNIE